MARSPMEQREGARSASVARSVHLLGLINNVLNLTRIETGRVEYRVRPVLVSSVLADLASLCSRSSRRATSRWSRASPTEGSGSDLHVAVDREKLIQILTNLLGNAAKFTARGGEVELRLETGDARIVQVQVRDSGPRRSRRQARGDLRAVRTAGAFAHDAVRGRGLGLAISRDLARGMGGELGPRADRIRRDVDPDRAARRHAGSWSTGLTARRLVGAYVGMALLLRATDVHAQSEAPRPDFHARFVELASRQATSDSARLHALFALDWEYTNVDAPEMATVVGTPGQDERWTDNSLPAIRRRRDELTDRLLVLRTINRARLNDVDQLSFDVFARNAKENVDGTRFPSELLAVTQRDGPQYASGIIARMSTVTTADYEHIVARLAALPRLIDQTLVLLDSGTRCRRHARRASRSAACRRRSNGSCQTRRCAARCCCRSRTCPRLSRPRSPRATDGAGRTRVYGARATRLSSVGVVPRHVVHPARTDDDRVEHPPRWTRMVCVPREGRDHRPAARLREIHDIGREGGPPHPCPDGQCGACGGYGGDFASFVAMLRTDPRFYMETRELVRAYRGIAQRIEPQLPRLFGRLPRLPYEIAAVP